MLKNLARTFTIAAALSALVTPATFAQLGTDPEPWVVQPLAVRAVAVHPKAVQPGEVRLEVVHVILAYLGLA